MRLTKFLIMVLVITPLAVLYVRQQNKIIQMAYQEQEKLALLDSLVDKNNKLRYNINHRTSLVLITRFWQEGNFEWPHQRQMVSLSSAKQTLEGNQEIQDSQDIFTRLFGLKSQAEATPVKPR